MMLAFRLISLVLVLLFQAQTPEFRLDVRRTFGYGNGSDVRGDFELRIYGDASQIRSVTYLMDGSVMNEAAQPPFTFKFNTGQYAPGPHQLIAVVHTTDGRSVETPPVGLNFLSAEQERDSMQRIFIPIFIGILVLTVGGVLIQGLFLRGDQRRLTPGAPRNYGMLGGTICPRCNRPYPIHFWSLSLVVGRLDRCDFCGKWAIVRRYDPSVLAAAEQAERAALRTAENAPLAAPLSEEERLRKLLDESKYIDH